MSGPIGEGRRFAANRLDQQNRLQWFGEKVERITVHFLHHWMRGANYTGNKIRRIRQSGQTCCICSASSIPQRSGIIPSHTRRFG